MAELTRARCGVFVWVAQALAACHLALALLLSDVCNVADGEPLP